MDDSLQHMTSAGGASLRVSAGGEEGYIDQAPLPVEGLDDCTAAYAADASEHHPPRQHAECLLWCKSIHSA